jgi:GNAT superfamily N-acetyltransferase
MNPLEEYSFSVHVGSEAAHTPEIVEGISDVFSHSFGTNPRTGKPYRLGPKTTKDRLLSTGHVFVARSAENEIIAYLYARVIRSENGIVVWVDSLAVLPTHRLKGIATHLVTQLLETIPESRWVGCATPNPVAAWVITKGVGGTPYLGECDPPNEVISMIEYIRPQCPDLQGADFNPTKLLVKTKFTPVMSEDATEWRPPHPSEPPPWWASLENLPEGYEALLIIDRQ